MKTVIICKDKKPCIICSKPAEFVDISHARICSKECLEAFNHLVAEQED